MRGDQLDDEFDSPVAIGYDLLSSRQHARLRAVQQERLELIARRKRREEVESLASASRVRSSASSGPKKTRKKRKKRRSRRGKTISRCLGAA